ncbi:MAG: hypothetical protein U0905_13400 [Pirellulales bacterium]
MSCDVAQFDRGKLKLNESTEREMISKGNQLLASGRIFEASLVFESVLKGLGSVCELSSEATNCASHWAHISRNDETARAILVRFAKEALRDLVEGNVTTGLLTVLLLIVESMGSLLVLIRIAIEIAPKNMELAKFIIEGVRLVQSESTSHVRFTGQDLFDGDSRECFELAMNELGSVPASVASEFGQAAHSVLVCEGKRLQLI